MYIANANIEDSKYCLHLKMSHNHNFKLNFSIPLYLNKSQISLIDLTEIKFAAIAHYIVHNVNQKLLITQSITVLID